MRWRGKLKNPGNSDGSGKGDQVDVSVANPPLQDLGLLGLKTIPSMPRMFRLHRIQNVSQRVCIVSILHGSLLHAVPRV